MKHHFLNQTLKGTKLYILLTLLLSVISAKLVVTVPMFIQYALDGIVMGKEEVIPPIIRNLFLTNQVIDQILILVAVLIGINVLIFITNYLKSLINTKFNLRINRNIKQSVLEHVPKLEYMQFCGVQKSNVIQRVNNDATTCSEFFNTQIVFWFDTIFVLVFAIQKLFSLNLVVAIFIMAIAAFTLIVTVWFLKKSKPLEQDVLEKNSTMIEKTTSSIENAKMMKIFNRKEKELKDFKEMNDQYRRNEVKLAKLKVWYRIGVHSIRNFKEPFILLWGGILVIHGEITMAVLALLLTYSVKVGDYMYHIAANLENLNRFVVAYQKLNQLMQYKEETDNGEKVPLQGDIVFKNVTITIEGNVLLQNLNFTIERGKNTAIVGDNGSGKSTIIKTLIGFYDYTGEIYIGNDSLKQISKKSVRQYISVVLQETYLFTDTVEQNINITNKIVTNKQMIEVCKLAEVYSDIKNFEGNFTYLIGKGGNNVSGGQKQRIAIARALLLDCHFLVLDDSLSKLDRITKHKVLENMIQMKKSAILLSHDVEVIQSCHAVLFVHHKTVEVGTHESLMEKNKQYVQIIEVSQNAILVNEEE